MSQAKAYFISFPKTGRTWLRIILSKIIYDHFKLKDQGVPENYLLNIEQLCKLAKIRPVEMTHDDSAGDESYKLLETDKSRYYSRYVILLIRDPRDTIVSWYFHRTKRWYSIKDKGIPAFIRSKQYGIKKFIRFYNIWGSAINHMEHVLVVRYEDLHLNTKRVVLRILNFLNICDVPDSIINSAIEFAQFSNLKKLERENYFHHRKMRPSDLFDDNSYKTRKGVVHGFIDHLTPEDIRFLNIMILRAKSSLLTFYKEAIKYESVISRGQLLDYN